MEKKWLLLLSSTTVPCRALSLNCPLGSLPVIEIYIHLIHLYYNKLILKIVTLTNINAVCKVEVRFTTGSP